MWKSVDGRLVQATDNSRVKFRTNISKTVLNNLKKMADDHNTHVNYLLESGLRNLLEQGEIMYSKESRPKDRVQYKTTYNQELLESTKDFAKKHDLRTNDIIEFSVQFIDINKSKDRAHRYRIEK
ncbi:MULTISPECIES: rRNA methyltransferase [Pontibacillus]|uniref:rRNA methyltransferase n=1 Tax=Pontibacillus chungwhensis TaxID=265426 RepID=A0ABY8URV0_9BACI|nr:MULTISPECIES: rRNA methyltransferase [Pontibacillus]MCD5322846.1 rRNA methyltransferase [Pontibacillus sp. HN14]WIF96244.1 rRNA methyltransferase [Pontibacillus chungwhensis]